MYRNQSLLKFLGRNQQPAWSTHVPIPTYVYHCTISVLHEYCIFKILLIHLCRVGTSRFLQKSHGYLRYLGVKNNILLNKHFYHTPAASAVLLNWNYEQICLFGQILTGHTGGQLYSDISPYKVSECSLLQLRRG